MPDVLVASGEHGIDGPVAVLENGGLRLTLDASPFADPLTGYQSKAGYRSWQEEIDGASYDLVAFDNGDGGTVVAARIPGSLTATAHLGAGVDDGVALEIIRSIAQRQGETDG